MPDLTPQQLDYSGWTRREDDDIHRYYEKKDELIDIDASGLPGYRFFVSDNPEIITDTMPTTAGLGRGLLWREHVVIPESTQQRHRLYLYHVNQTGGERYIGIAIKNTSDADIVIQDGKEVMRGGGGPLPRDGLAIAKGGLGDPQTLQNLPTNGLVIPVGATRVIRAGSRGNTGGTNFIGGIIDLTVKRNSPGTGLNYWVFAAAHDTEAAITTIDPVQTPPPDLYPPDSDEWVGHSRGSWKTHQIAISMERPYVVGSATANLTLAQHYFEPRGKDVLQFTGGSTPEDPKSSKPNKGLFGVNQHITISATNSFDQERRVRVQLAAIRLPDSNPLGRNPRPVYAGAVSTSAGFHGIARPAGGAVVPLRTETRDPNTGVVTPSNENAVNVMEFIDLASFPVPAAASGMSGQNAFTFMLQHGAVSSLPVGILLSTVPPS